jgi:hypothetical protein
MAWLVFGVDKGGVGFFLRGDENSGYRSGGIYWVEFGFSC